jgi:hypothetical protein
MVLPGPAVKHNVAKAALLPAPISSSISCSALLAASFGPKIAVKVTPFVAPLEKWLQFG